MLVESGAALDLTSDTIIHRATLKLVNCVPGNHCIVGVGTAVPQPSRRPPPASFSCVASSSHVPAPFLTRSRIRAISGSARKGSNFGRAISIVVIVARISFHSFCGQSFINDLKSAAPREHCNSV